MPIPHIHKHTHLAGVGAPLQNPCTKHAAVQYISIDLRSFASLMRDQENTSIQQLAADTP